MNNLPNPLRAFVNAYLIASNEVYRKAFIVAEVGLALLFSDRIWENPVRRARYRELFMSARDVLETYENDRLPTTDQTGRLQDSLMTIRRDLRDLASEKSSISGYTGAYFTKGNLRVGVQTEAISYQSGLFPYASPIIKPCLRLEIGDFKPSEGFHVEGGVAFHNSSLSCDYVLNRTLLLPENTTSLSYGIGIPASPLLPIPSSDLCDMRLSLGVRVEDPSGAAFLPGLSLLTDQECTVYGRVDITQNRWKSLSTDQWSSVKTTERCTFSLLKTGGNQPIMASPVSVTGKERAAQYAGVRRPPIQYIGVRPPTSAVLPLPPPNPMAVQVLMGSVFIAAFFRRLQAGFPILDLIDRLKGRSSGSSMQDPAWFDDDDYDYF